MNCRIFFLIFCFVLPLIAETNPEAENKIADSSNDVSERYGLFRNKRKDGPRFLSLSPGVLYNSSALDIKTPFGTAKMDDTVGDTASLQFLYDIKSKEWRLGEYWGVFLLNRNIRFRQTRQVVSYGAVNADGSDARQTVDLGTETYGSYNVLLPVFFIGSAKAEGFRLGAGFGVGSMSVRGTADINGGLGTFINASIFNSGRNLDEKIDTLGRYSLLTTGNLDNDPYRLYLLSNLSQGDNLQNLAIYSAARGDIRASTIQPLAFLLYQSQSAGALNPLELIALSTIGQGQVNGSSRLAKSFYFFFEVPLAGITYRIGGGGPFYEVNDTKFSIKGFEFSAYVPIDF